MGGTKKVQLNQNLIKPENLPKVKAICGTLLFL